MTIYKEMVKLFLELYTSVSFKIISLPVKGIKDKNNALDQLFYHLIIRGIEHEHSSGRAVLPRGIQVWKDKDSEGPDTLLKANLQDKLEQCSKNRFDGNLHIKEIECVDSEANIFIQMADLLSACANRVINKPQTEFSNHKSTFAEYFLNLIGAENSFFTNDNIEDMSVHIFLGK